VISHVDKKMLFPNYPLVYNKVTDKYENFVKSIFYSFKEEHIEHVD